MNHRLHESFASRKICGNSHRFYKAIKMTPNEKWEQDIHITDQKRLDRNLVQNQHETGEVLNQGYQYLRQNLNPKTNNNYTTISTNMSINKGLVH